MFEIPTYRAERDAGLGKALGSSLTYASAATLSSRASMTEAVRASLRHHARGAITDFDLQPIEAVLATVGWNGNDDVFDPLEVWVARRSPSDKPFNLEHDCSDIVGHITGSRVTDEQGKDVGDDTPVDDLPAKFHILTSAVLYKVWAKHELQARMDGILAEVAAGKWFVSMECLFKGFDYGMRGADGSTRVVARNEQTAFLTKHLRSYGSTGRYGGQQVGRVLRNITFSGKGLVRKPANPESVILSAPPAAAEATTASAIASYMSWRREGRGGRKMFAPDRQLSPVEHNILAYFGGRS